MLNLWIKKIQERLKSFDIKSCWDKLTKFIKMSKQTKSYRCHMINLSLLIGAYIIGSFFIYPQISWKLLCKELFALLCIYGALFCWFTEKFSENNTLRVCLITTTFLAPVIFINNTMSVAFVCLFLMVTGEYIIFSYIQGHNLFSKKIPVYIICETQNDLENACKIISQYKTLELILLSPTKCQNLKLSRIRDIESLDNHLNKIQSIPFFPLPRKFIYCSENKNLDSYCNLLKIATKYSISVLTFNENEISPTSIRDLFDEPVIADENSLMNIFKNKNIWICYDGRRSVLDLICILSKIASVNLTIVCESECLIMEVDQTLMQINNFKNYRIKTVALSFLILNETRPDILFYNIPVKSRFSDEDHLKEALIKNVIDTDKIIKLAQKVKIPLTFVLSDLNAVHLNNWTGATQRLGELLCQHADFQCRKTSSRFKIIRIPENISDKYGFLGEVVSSVLYFREVVINSTKTDLDNLYYSKDITPLLLKAVMLSYKSEKTAEVLTVIPTKKANPKKLTEDICNMYGLCPNRDIKIHFSQTNDSIELEALPNITEHLTKTSILNVFSTKFVTSSVGNYEDLWTEEQISKMNPREIIAEVFQSIANKINPQNRPSQMKLNKEVEH